MLFLLLEFQIINIFDKYDSAGSMVWCFNSGVVIMSFGNFGLSFYTLNSKTVSF